MRDRIELEHYEATHGERYSGDGPSLAECILDDRQADPGPEVPFVPLTREELGMDPMFDVLEAIRADEEAARDAYGDRAVDRAIDRVLDEEGLR